MFKKNHATRGFGMIELIVSMSIVTIVTGIVITRHNAFNGAILLRNQAYEIAFVIRQAQQLAVSGQTDPLTSQQKQRYGVHFSPATGSNQSIILYKDNSPYSTNYDSRQDAVIQTVRLDSRFRINRINSADTPRSVVFERPFFDAISAATFPLRIEIVPVAGGSVVRTIVVSASGQVMVE
jgi:prepilin-type N-terminal cleavage/methylation domain-containing protein